MFKYFKVNKLLKNLDSANERVYSDAIESLGKMRVKRAVIPIIKYLEHNDIFIREKAAKALAKIGDNRAVEPLIKLLNDDNNKSIVCGATAYALGEIGDKRAIEPLINKVIKNAHLDAIVALGKFGDKRAVEPLTIVLNKVDKLFNILDPWQCEANYEFKKRIFEVLGKLGDKNSAETIIKAFDITKFNHKNIEGPVVAFTKALGKLENKQAVEPLLKLLGNSQQYIRQNAAEALSKLGENKWLQIISDSNDTFIDKLGKINDERKHLVLLEALTDNDYDFVNNAIETICRLDDEKVVETLTKALSGRCINIVRFKAAIALTKLVDLQAVDPLIAQKVNALLVDHSRTLINVGDFECYVGELVYLIDKDQRRIIDYTIDRFEGAGDDRVIVLKGRHGVHDGYGYVPSRKWSIESIGFGIELFKTKEKAQKKLQELLR